MAHTSNLRNELRSALAPLIIHGAIGVTDFKTFISTFKAFQDGKAWDLGTEDLRVEG